MDAQWILDDQVQDIISNSARILSRGSGFTPNDIEDLKQDLTLALLERRHKYDPQRGRPAAFASRVIRNVTANIIRHRMALKRNPRGHLNGPGKKLKPEKPLGIHENDLCDRYRDKQFGRRGRPEAEILELSMDINKAQEKLPDEQNCIIDLLKVKSKPETANELKIPLSTLQGRVRQIRSKFEKDNLQDYLRDRPSDNAPLV